MPGQSNSPKQEASPTRRELLAAATFVPLATLTANAQPPAPAGALSEPEMKMLEAFIDRLIPTDELGPGAVEANAQVYIDRALAGPNAKERELFLQGLQAVDAYARNALGAPLAQLSAEKRDELLTAIDRGPAADLQPFFNRARRLTLEGMFGDPFYGGNRNFAGWDLIRYPGPRPAAGPDEQKMDVEIKPYRRSAWGPQYK